LPDSPRLLKRDAAAGLVLYRLLMRQPAGRLDQASAQANALSG
jgi:hypothetical protein